MPLYGGVGGAQKELNLFYAGVGGAAKQLDMLYGGVGGAAKELLPSGYSWKKYAISDTPNLIYDSYTTSAYVRSTTGYIFYTPNISNMQYSNGEVVFATEYGDGKCLYYAIPEDNTYHYTVVNNYVPLGSTGNVSVASNVRTTVTASKVLLVTQAANGRLYGDVYTVSAQKGSYIETIKATKLDAYPINGEQDGYWYVFDGDITWNKYVLNEIYEPSEYNTAESFSSSQSYPLLMASQAKKDGNGNVDWGTTYSASSAANLRSNYSTYPFCSFASTLNADNLYKITTASILSYKRQKVSAWSLTSQSAGDLIGSVKGKYGDYPEDGIQDGYWYIMQEIV